MVELGNSIAKRSLNHLPMASILLSIAFCISVSVYYGAMILDSDAPIEFLITNFLIIILSLYLLLNGSKFPFSLHSVFYTFSLIFFGFIPLNEYNNNIIYWGNFTPIFEKYTYGSLLCLASIILFHIIYIYNARKKHGIRSLIGSPPIEVRDYILVIISSISSLIIYYLNNFYISSVFVRGGEYLSREFSGSTQFLIYQYFIYPLPTITLVCYLLYSRHKYLIGMILIFLFIISNPATGMARFQAATLYMAVIASAFPSLLRIRHLFSVSLITGLFFINPILNQFRYYSGEGIYFLTSSEFISSGEFDSFQNFMTAIYIDNVTYGRQLLGVLLFFVPRSIWPEKPIGSGARLAEDAGFIWSNISMNFLGEGFVNFGFVGIFVFLVAISVLAEKLDREFWNGTPSGKAIIRIFSLFSFGLFFFMLRGDLMSSFAYAVGMFSAVSLVAVAALRRR